MTTSNISFFDMLIEGQIKIKPTQMSSKQEAIL